MPNYTFGFSGSYTSDDPLTMSGAVNINLTVQADDIEAAKAALADVFTPSTGSSTVDVSGITIIPA